MENKIKCKGVLNLIGVAIPCYVLENGTRVLSGRGMQEALKMVEIEEGSSRTSGARLRRYLDQKTLNPFIYKDKEVGHYDPIACSDGRSKINGYEATALVDICEAFLEAREHIELSPRQEIIAQQCEVLVRAFAKIGIISLVDEATGFQYEREKNALEAIANRLVSDEILEYQKQFHLSFYRELFRLWGVPFTEDNIKRKPRFFGHLTNRYIYANMPAGTVVLRRLKEQTPRNASGGFKYKLHQSLTIDEGRECLKKVIYSIETLASISRTKEEFDRLVNERYGQKSIPFEDFDPKTTKE